MVVCCFAFTKNALKVLTIVSYDALMNCVPILGLGNLCLRNGRIFIGGNAGGLIASWC